MANTFSSPIISLPLCIPQKDIDTDAIIPATFLKTTKKTGLGKHLFENLRTIDPDFPKIKEQRIIVAGKNFGCGSSREHAPWALKDAGIDVIISSEFADIFRGNAEKNNILLIDLPEEIVQIFLKSKSALTVNLKNQEIVDNLNQKYSFKIPTFIKKKFLENTSDLDYLLTLSKKIKSFGVKHPLNFGFALPK